METHPTGFNCVLMRSRAKVANVDWKQWDYTADYHGVGKVKTGRYV